MKAVFVLAAIACVAQAQFNPFGFFGRRPSRPVNRPPPQQTFFRPAPAQQARPAAAPVVQQQSSRGRCDADGFHVSAQRLDGNSARGWCGRNGFRDVSLDNPQKTSAAYAKVSRLPYFWVAATKAGGRNVRWPNGAVTVPEWSHTGGARRPQPDARDGPEPCIAILNNFYGDGIKFHDINCRHTKPVLCEC